jgi:hypothetical protein
MKMLSLITNSWGQEILLFIVVVIVVCCLCALVGFFRDWLVAAFKIKDVLDKLDEVSRKLESIEKKINEKRP